MDTVIEQLPKYFEGFSMTLTLLVASGSAALILGTIIAICRISPISSLRIFGATYTEIIRNVPLTLVLFFCATVMPQLAPSPGYTVLAIAGLAVYTSPFVAEAIRSGINGVPVGQAEAARSIGLNFFQVLTLIILPQAFRMVIPPLVNVFIALTKNTSVAGGFYVVELFAVGRGLANEFGNATVPILLGVATFYLLITIPLGQLAALLERKVGNMR